MKKGLLLLVSLVLTAMMPASCSKPPATQTAQEPAAADTALSHTDKTASLTEEEAGKIAQKWVDSHPFQLGSNLETEYAECLYDGAEYYPFHVGVTRFGIVEILVHRVTGELFHFMSPGNDRLEPLDDWYYREHSPEHYAIEWITVMTDWMCIDIPSSWSWSYGPDYPGLDDIDIYNEDGSIYIFVGYMIAGNPEDYIAENLPEPFIFNSGTIGYMLESEEQIMWLNPDLFLGSGVGFYHGGNRASYISNEDVILHIARSYRSN